MFITRFDALPASIWHYVNVSKIPEVQKADIELLLAIYFWRCHLSSRCKPSSVCSWAIGEWSSPGCLSAWLSDSGHFRALYAGWHLSREFWSWKFWSPGPKFSLENMVRLLKNLSWLKTPTLGLLSQTRDYKTTANQRRVSLVTLNAPGNSQTKLSYNSGKPSQPRYRSN